MNEFISSLEERAEPLDGRAEQRSAVGRARLLAVEALGPLTILAGIVWAIAQPYRIVFLRDSDAGIWDYLGQPPLLVMVVGLLFAILIAPGLVEDMRAAESEQEDTGDAAPR
jgi:hypothetical protein